MNKTEVAEEVEEVTETKKPDGMIDIVITPSNPNADKILSYYLMMKYAVGTAWELGKNHVVSFFSAGSLPEGMSTTDEAFKRTVFLDCAGGEFDGHGENKAKSGAQLVAEKLGISTDQGVETLIRRVTFQDKHGRKSQNHIASVVINAYRVGRNFKEICAWSFQAFDAISRWEGNLSTEDYAKNETHPWYSMVIDKIAVVLPTESAEEWLAWGQKVIEDVDVLISQAREELKTANYRIIPTFAGKKKLFICRSSNPFLASTAFEQVDVVISRLEHSGRSTTMIQVSNSSGLHLQQVITRIRLAEAEKLGIQIDESWEVLACEGKHPQLPMWHVLESKKLNGVKKSQFKLILNGSEQHPYVVITLLTGAELLKIVMDGLAPRLVKKDKSTHMVEILKPKKDFSLKTLLASSTV